MAILHTEAGYRIRPAFATAHVDDVIRFVNLTGEEVSVELPIGLHPLPNLKRIPPREQPIPAGQALDAAVNANTLDHSQGGSPWRRWQVHYSVFRSKNRSLIPGESSPEIIIDEQP